MTRPEACLEKFQDCISSSHGPFLIRLGPKVGRDNTSNFYSQFLYKTLEEGLVFQQDNAWIHTAMVVQDHGIRVVKRPPHSPNLNPIERVWNMLKSKAATFL